VALCDVLALLKERNRYSEEVAWNVVRELDEKTVDFRRITGSWMCSLPKVKLSFNKVNGVLFLLIDSISPLLVSIHFNLESASAEKPELCEHLSSGRSESYQPVIIRTSHEGFSTRFFRQLLSGDRRVA
jgi:hypothetical protein